MQIKQLSWRDELSLMVIILLLLAVPAAAMGNESIPPEIAQMVKQLGLRSNSDDNRFDDLRYIALRRDSPPYVWVNGICPNKTVKGCGQRYLMLFRVAALSRWEKTKSLFGAKPQRHLEEIFRVATYDATLHFTETGFDHIFYEATVTMGPWSGGVREIIVDGRYDALVHEDLVYNSPRSSRDVYGWINGVLTVVEESCDGKVDVSRQDHARLRELNALSKQRDEATTMQLIAYLNDPQEQVSTKAYELIDQRLHSTKEPPARGLVTALLQCAQEGFHAGRCTALDLVDPTWINAADRRPLIASLQTVGSSSTCLLDFLARAGELSIIDQLIATLQGAIDRRDACLTESLLSDIYAVARLAPERVVFARELIAKAATLEDCDDTQLASHVDGVLDLLDRNPATP